MRTSFQLYAKLAVILVMASPFACFAGDQPSKTTAIAADMTQFKLDIRFIGINREKLSDAGIDLHELTQDASLADRREESGGDRALTALLNKREGNMITKLLTASGAGKVIAEPTIVVSDGRAASLQTVVDGAVAIVATKGIQGTVTNSQIYVVTIDVLANKQPGGSVRLELRAEHAKLRDAKDASASQALERRVLDTALELNSGQTAMVVSGHGLTSFLVMVGLELIEPAETAGNAQNQPLGSFAAPVTESQIAAELRQLEQHLGPQHPRIVELKAKIDQLRETTSSTPTLHVAPASRVEEPPTKPTLRKEIRELREEVKDLRREVGRIIELLEERHDETRLETAPAPRIYSSPDAADSSRNSSLSWPEGPKDDANFRTVWRLSLREATKIAMQHAGLKQFEFSDDPEGVVWLANKERTADANAIAARDVIGKVEQAYWQLWAAQQDLETSRLARDSAQELWKNEYEKLKGGEKSGRFEALSREHYFEFRVFVEQSLVATARHEEELRKVLGLARTDGRTILAADQPNTASVDFPSAESPAKALANSPELQQSRRAVVEAELKLMTVRVALAPKLQTVLPDGNALEANFAVPAGHRQELASVRNAELILARAQAREKNTELELSGLLSTAFRELDNSWQLLQMASNRSAACKAETESLTSLHAAGKVTFDDSLDARRRFAAAETGYHAAAARHAIALKNLRLHKGTLLTDRGFKIAEAEAPGSAQLSDSSARPYTIYIEPRAIEGLKAGSAYYHDVDEKNQGVRRIRVVLHPTVPPNSPGNTAVISAVQQGWRPRKNGGMDYYLQLSEEQFDAFAGGTQFECHLDPSVNSIRSFFVFVGDKQLPHELSE